jgi:hypothetical protein
LIALASGPNQGLAEALSRKAAALKVELAGSSPAPVERLLAERVVVTWLHVYWIETAVAQAAAKTSTTIRQSAFTQERLDRAHRRYLTALRELASAQRLLPKGKKAAVASSAKNGPRDAYEGSAVSHEAVTGSGSSTVFEDSPAPRQHEAVR